MSKAPSADLEPGERAAPRPSGDAEQLRRLVQELVRSFGLLAANQTPCGQPVSPSYAHALMILLERRRPAPALSQAELGALLGIDKSNVARLCARMEAAGHLVQKRTPDDGRSRLLALTAKGTKLATRIEESSHARFDLVIAAIPEGRRRALFDGLTTLNSAVQALRDSEENGS